MTLIYLDHAATTPMRQRTVDAMIPYFTEQYANPSGSHRFARTARKVIDESRDQIADLLGVKPGEVVFTSGGTEADNTVIAGIDGTALCSAAEHHAVVHPVAEGGGIVVGTDACGHIDLDQLEAALTEQVGVVSVMAVNNEVGTISDLAAVSALVRRIAPHAVIHTDAVQAAHWLDVRTISPHVDLMSFSAHKFGGPKGIGVLTIREGTDLSPLIEGGGQERERRSGTQNVAGIVGLTRALLDTDSERDSENIRLTALRDGLIDGLTAKLEGVHETVPRNRKVAGSAHVMFEGIESESLLFMLDEADVCASAAAACASGAMEPSHVLAAMGIDRSLAAGALRMSLGDTTTSADIDRTIDVVAESVDRLRRG